MQNGFMKGLILGGLIGASVGVMMEPGVMKRTNRRRMVKAGRNFVRRSGNIIGDMVDVLR